MPDEELQSSNDLQAALETVRREVMAELSNRVEPHSLIPDQSKQVQVDLVRLLRGTPPTQSLLHQSAQSVSPQLLDDRKDYGFLTDAYVAGIGQLLEGGGRSIVGRDFQDYSHAQAQLRVGTPSGVLAAAGSQLSLAGRTTPLQTAVSSWVRRLDCDVNCRKAHYGELSALIDQVRYDGIDYSVHFLLIPRHVRVLVSATTIGGFKLLLPTSLTTLRNSVVCQLAGIPDSSIPAEERTNLTTMVPQQKAFIQYRHHTLTRAK